jgi:hypothetical protein
MISFGHSSDIISELSSHAALNFAKKLKVTGEVVKELCQNHG